MADFTTDAFPPTIPHEAVAALARGNKIEAIKIVRVASSVGLKEAKEIVEKFVASNPAVQLQMAAANAETAKSSFGTWLIIAMIAAAAYGFFFDAA